MMTNSPSDIERRLECVTFGERLTLAMYRRKLNNAQLGDMIHIDHSLIAKFRTDKRLPRLETAIAICKALRVSMDWMCGLRD